MGDMVMLNEAGHMKIEWPPEHADYVAALVEQKMKEGVVFYTIPERKPGQRGKVAGPKPLKSASEVAKHTALEIRDEGMAQFVLSGKGKVSCGAPADLKGAKRATDPAEVAAGSSVAVKPRAGG